MEFIKIFFIIVIPSIAISIKIKRKTEELVPLVTMGLILIVYLCGIIDNLNIGIYIIEIITIIALIYILYAISKVSNKRDLIKNALTPAILIYALMYIFFIFLGKGRIFGNYDEFNHWGLIIKDLFLNDNFAFARESATMFNEYPPYLRQYSNISY